MHSPDAALAWEFWRRHRRGLIFVAATVLGFVLFYPLLCHWADFDSGDPDMGGEIGKKLSADMHLPMLPRFFTVLYLFFLAGGPMLAMFITLIFVVWMFTFTEVDRRNKDFLAFPPRWFTLPVSDSFLFWRLTLSALAAVDALCAVWNFGVRVPHFESFAIYGNALVWMTLMVLVQAIIWSLAAWPFLRMLALIGLALLYLGDPDNLAPARSPAFSALLMLPGLVLARIGLQKMRHGQWQGKWWNDWLARAAQWLARREMRGPRRFASPAQAQLWFEWRRSMVRLCVITAALVLMPLAVLAVRAALGYAPLEPATQTGLFFIPFAAPVMIFGLHGISLGHADQSFLLVRPLTSGDFVAAILKATALGVLATWVAVWAIELVMVRPAGLDFSGHFDFSHPARWTALVMGLLFLTWRFAVAHLCFMLTENQRLMQTPPLLLVALWLGGVTAFVLAQNGVPFGWFWNYLPFWLTGLLAVKFLLAYRIFRAALRRRLVTPSAVARYLVVWTLLVGALLTVPLLLVRPGQGQILPLCQAMVLLVPLARIALAPFALSWARHTTGGPTTRWPTLQFRPPSA